MSLTRTMKPKGALALLFALCCFMPVYAAQTFPPLPG